MLLTAKELPPGELVKDEHFTLFEAVGALEVSSVFVPVWMHADHGIDWRP